MYYFISSNSQSAKEINMKHINSYCLTQKCVKGMVDGKLQCLCGEEIEIFHWTWAPSVSSSNTRISNHKDILFHPLYSSGTAAVRGNMPFQQNLHYYWEIKMLTNLYGTDVMVGVGTSKIDFSEWRFRFCSLLGIDSQSWGYSYHGKVHHNNSIRRYGSQFGLGSIVGVHLNMCNGTLEYYMNRKPMGIAFKDLKSKELYPMVSSTAAQSAMRIICSATEESTLQMRCLEFISKHPALYEVYKEIPGLVRYYKRKYFWIVPTTEDEEKHRQASLKEIGPFYSKKLKLKKNRRWCPLRWLPPEILNASEEEDVNVHVPRTLRESTIRARREQSDEGSSNAGSSDGGPSTSKQNCDEELRSKIRRTDSSVCQGDCYLHANLKYCVKCKFRRQIEDED